MTAPPPFIILLQRLGAKAVLNDFLVSVVFGAPPVTTTAAAGGEHNNGHLNLASMLIGEFEKLIKNGTIKGPSSSSSSRSDKAEGGKDADETADSDLVELISKDISQYVVTTSALPPVILSGAGLLLNNNATNSGSTTTAAAAGGDSNALSQIAIETSTDGTPTAAAIVKAAKFLYDTTAAFYDYFNEDQEIPIPFDLFARIFTAALSQQGLQQMQQQNDNNNSAKSFIATASAFASFLSIFLKTAQIQLQKSGAVNPKTGAPYGEEDPETEIPFHKLCGVVDIILHHFPSAFFIEQCCVAVGDTIIVQEDDDDAMRLIGRRRKRLNNKNKQQQQQGLSSTENDNANTANNNNVNGPLIGASARAKTAREVFAEEQMRKAGMSVASSSSGTYGGQKQATFDEARQEVFDVEVNDNIPSFLKDVARKNYINYRRAPVNLAEKREQEAQQAARKALASANAAAAAGGGTAGLKTTSSLLALAEIQEKKNLERKRVRDLERKRQEMAEVEAAATTRQRNEFNYDQNNEDPNTNNADEENNNGNSTIAFEPKLTDGELDANDLEVSAKGGVRSEKDTNNLPPWLRNSLLAGGNGKISFGLHNANQNSEKSMEEQRRSLPVFASRDQIVEHVRTHTVTILQGETGSGKTTQIPQYLCDAGLTKRDPSDRFFTTSSSGGGGGVSGTTGMRQREELMIAITQPRRVAAIELAKRVAKERGTRCGDEVGYTVRFDDQTSDRTKIKYMTDGMLLREALLDDVFSRYSVIILDEAHERSINTDVLFGVLKKAVAKRPSLKLVITSATIELERFCQYFGVNDCFKIQGRTFPVDIKYLDKPCSDYVEQAITTALTIHITDKELKGDILIFLTGEDEINATMDRLQARFVALREKAHRELPPERHPYDLLILPCYATVPNEAMSKVFEKTPPKCRKVVVSTNVAETSITIDGLSYVIDSGFCKQHVYDPKNKVEELKIVPVSQAQATQRTGRAGRTNPGTCYRLFTQDQFENEMTPATVPEIQRTNLINIVLTLKAVGFDDLLEFDFLDPPPKETLVNALQTLRYLEALDDDGLLTPIGERMSSLPLPPTESKTLLASIDLGCAPTVMTIVSMMGQRKVFFSPQDKREEADFAHRQLKHPDGDQLTLANVYNSWVESGMSEKWCKANFVNPRAVTDARRARDQLQQMLQQRHNISSDNKDSVAIRKALTSGYFFQTAKRDKNNMYVTMSDRRTVAMHPSSSLYEQNPQYVVYHQLALKRQEYMMQVMRIEPQWLVQLAPAYYNKPKKGELTKEQKAMRVDPILKPWDSKNSWRISKLKKKTR